jgi:hypothetical protein
VLSYNVFNIIRVDVFCFFILEGITRIQNTSGEIANGAVGKKSLTENTTWLVWGGGAAKYREASSNLFYMYAMLCKGNGFLRHCWKGIQLKRKMTK